MATRRPINRPKNPHEMKLKNHSRHPDADLIQFKRYSNRFWKQAVKTARNWKTNGLHQVKFGQHKISEGRKRTEYREELLLKALPLFLDWKGKTCLDLGCNDGRWGLLLAQHGLHTVTGIDLNPANIKKANFLKIVSGYNDFRFVRADISQFMEQTEEDYDIVLLLSLIYHFPETIDKHHLFSQISKVNKGALIIDSRWFEDSSFWNMQTFIEIDGIKIPKWRPTRSEICQLLKHSGYESVFEIDTSMFVTNPIEKEGDRDPYGLENIYDYTTDHRSVLIAYKSENLLPNEHLLSLGYLWTGKMSE